MKFTLTQKRAMQADPQKFARSLSRTELLAVLKELDARYRKGVEIVTDEQYDIMDDYYWLTSKKEKTSKNVGGVKNADTKLEVPMPSLEKFTKLSDAKQKAFYESPVTFTISDKEDGISGGLTYDNGVPVMLTTRGENGTVGKDISKLIPLLKIPKKIPFKGRFIVRAEFTIDRAAFDRYFAKDFKTSRNMGAGLTNKNTAHENVRKYKLVCYEIMLGKGAGTALNEQFAIMERYGFEVAPYRVVKKISYDILAKIHDERKKAAGRDIDGIVVTKNIPYKIKAGYPTHAYAFKINSLASSVETVVTDIVWEETRLGRLHPTIKIEPTIIGGVLVSSFTGHSNFYIEHGYKQELEDNPPYAKPRPINVGATIRAVRSGDVIPFIMEVVKGSKTPSKPKGEYKRRGVQLYAVHDQKSDMRRVKELTYFFTELEVDGMKQGTVQILVDAGYNTVKKIMKIKLADAQTLPGFAAKSGKTLFDNLQDAKSRFTFQNIARASAAFGEGIGEKRLQYIIDAYPDFLERASHESTSSAELADLISSVKGFKKLAIQVAENFKRFTKFCERNGISLVAEKKKEVTGAAMSGQSVLFTSVRDKEAQDWIVANGGKIASTVNQATLIIIKDEAASNKKTEAAQSKGIAIQTLANFRKKHRI